MRIDDIDPPREVPGAAHGILRCLEDHGFCWDGQVRWQSQRLPAHAGAVEYLLATGLAYHCDCSRSAIRAAARKGPAGPVYPGTCRTKPRGAVSPDDAAVRIRTAPAIVEFVDGVLGRMAYRIDRDVGDFVIRRRDGLMAYTLATVVDDRAQGITEVVRGSDLLPTTPGQIWLQRLLQFRGPDYLHVPMVINAAGQKLSKQTGARPLDPTTPASNLVRALACLGQQPPAGLEGEAPDRVWAWATAHWRPEMARESAVAD